MSKNEFLAKLRRKLVILKKSEIDDIVDEYGGYIDEKIKKGKSEEEAIKDFGDFDELVKEILSAYKISEDFDEDQAVSNVLSNIFESIASAVDKLVKKVSKMSSGEIIGIIIEMLLVVLCLHICHFPFELVSNMGANIFDVLMSPFSNILIGIWRFVIEITYLVLVVIIFVKYFNTRYLMVDDVSIEREVRKVVRKNSRKKDDVVEDKYDDYKDERKKTSKNNDEEESTVFNSVFNGVFRGICKAFALLMAIPTVFVFTGIVIAFVLSIIFLGFGAHFIGIPIIILSLLIACSMFMDILFSVISSRKKTFVKIFSSLIISIVLFGIGCGICALEFANATYINDVPSRYELKTEKYDIEKKDLENYYLPRYFTNYIIDETLVDKVVVEVKTYDEFASFNLESSRVSRYYSIDGTSNTIFNGKKFFSLIKNDLKKKEFYNYGLLFEPIINVYGSKENLDVIASNRSEDYNYYGYGLTGNIFKRTYEINEIIDDNDSNNKYLVVSEVNGDVKRLVFVEKFSDYNVRSKGVYDFTLKVISEDIQDEFFSVLENSEIIDIKPFNLNNNLSESFYR